MIDKTVIARHPLPWRVDPGKYDTDLGGIEDANGESVIWLGIDEQYYPASGNADSNVLELIVSLVNQGGSP